MHCFIILFGIMLAWFIRQQWQPERQGSWSDRWQHTLRAFVLPPLLLLMIAIAVVCMGRSGWMVFGSEGWLYVWIAQGYLGAIVLILLHFARQGRQMLHRIRQYPQSRHGAYAFQLVDSPQPYSAQIGFWQPELVVSQGLFTHLAPEQVEAVLRHEQAHVYYRDTFWFFWLGWVRRCTVWLPQTEALWQELLLLREMRADRWAAQQGDPLTLAEALLEVIRAAIEPSAWAVPFGATEHCRVTERIEAMFLSDPEPPKPARLWWLGWALLPLCLIPIHC